MFTSFNAECDSSSRCSASPSGDNLYYPSPAGSYSSMGSPQSQVRLVKLCSFDVILEEEVLDAYVFYVPFGELGVCDKANSMLLIISSLATMHGLFR